MNVHAALACVLAFLATGTCGGASATNAFELGEVLAHNETGMSFDINAKVSLVYETTYASFAVEDSTGQLFLTNLKPPNEISLRPGDMIRASGTTAADGWGGISAICDRIDVLAHGPPPLPSEIPPEQLMNGNNDFKLTWLRGTVKDAFRDEIDPLWGFLVLNQGMRTIFVALTLHENESPDMNRYVGTEVEVEGMCIPVSPGYRRQIGRIFITSGLKTIRILREATTDPFSVPELGDMNSLSPADIAALGRRRTKGHVIAAWHGGNLLLRTPDRRHVRVELAKSLSPRYGDFVEVVGFPETDLYRINLTRGIWRKVDGPAMAEDKIQTPSAKSLLTGENGSRHVRNYFYGRTVRLNGSVRSLPNVNGGDGRIFLESGGSSILVDASACPDVLRGLVPECKVEVTGTCIMEMENWRPNAMFPHIREVMVVVRKADDIKVLQRPSWWTPRRLLAIIGTLLLALLAVLIWNASLHKLAERRGRDLLEEQLGNVKSRLKVIERTRIAVELHDALAQSLTGASMEIETAKRRADGLPSEIGHHLDMAIRTLKSCRDELRNCLWDLRNQALEETNLDTAIGLTLMPHVNDTKLSVRFNVPRSRLSDDMTHALLRIIRELVINALRHGRASMVRIAGSMEEDRVLFSVTDNGCGFSPDTCPGVLQGHFGLQGIRERVEKYKGSMTVESVPGKGTKITIVLRAPNPDEKRDES